MSSLEQRKVEALEKIAESLDRMSEYLKGFPGTEKVKPKTRKAQKKSGTDYDPEYTPEFLAFWKSYPRKTNKPDAFKAWNQTLALHPDDILTRVKRMSASWMQRDRSELKFCKYPASWLRAHGWDEDVTFNSQVKPMDPGHMVSINRIVQQESGQYYADPDWRDYKEGVSAGDIEPGFLAWKDRHGS